MPWTLPTRRSLLAAGAGALGATLLPGCTHTGARSGPDAEAPPERRMREAAVRESRHLLERYDATLAAHAALAPVLAPLRAAVAAHAAELHPDGPGATASPPPAGDGGRAAGPGASAGASAGATPGASPAAPVPARAADALEALAAAERALAGARTAQLAGAPGELARVLASVAACGHVHHHLLTRAKEDTA
ncbi:hypothetical protein [Streptomyces sp. NPDC012888]|uniref:hypothetical protein n=1 Tax=Streptomyces sp. NPDC012888 TaxID=3364855 RepID=UPI0036B64230